MGYLRLPYDDADTASAMRADCDRAIELLPRADARPTSLDKVKREISVDAAAVRLAAALDLD